MRLYSLHCKFDDDSRMAAVNETDEMTTTLRQRVAVATAEAERLKLRERHWTALVTAQQKAIRLTEQFAKSDREDRTRELHTARQALDRECSIAVEQLNALVGTSDSTALSATRDRDRTQQLVAQLNTVEKVLHVTSCSHSSISCRDYKIN